MGLGAGDPCQPTRPVRTVGFGTEPGWSLSIGQQLARLHVQQQPDAEFEVESKTHVSGETRFVLRRGGERATAVFRRAPDNDGMGDTLYPYAVEFGQLRGVGTLARGAGGGR